MDNKYKIEVTAYGRWEKSKTVWVEAGSRSEAKQLACDKANLEISSEGFSKIDWDDTYYDILETIEPV